MSARWHDTRPTRRRGTGVASILPLLAACALAVIDGSRVAAEAQFFDPDEPPATNYRLAPFLTFGAEIEADFVFRRNLDLDSRRDDRLSLLEPKLSVAFSFDPIPQFQAYLNVELTPTFVLARGAEETRRKNDVALELKEAYFRIGEIPDGLSLWIGRQKFEDERTWLYDEELDTVRLRYGRGPFVVDLSVSQGGLVRTDLLDDRSRSRNRTDNYILSAAYRLAQAIELEGYAIVRDAHALDEGRPVFLGVRARGEPVEDLDYWLELGYVGGRDGSRRLRGWGFDLGATYELQAGPKPALTLGVAFGSGERNAEGGLDRSFRQTGLQANEGDFGGSTNFKYYGEVLDPELSNLAIFTVGLGIRPREWFSVDLVYHYYLQVVASPTLRDAGITAEPSGRSRRLGSELDLIVGLVDLGQRVDIKAVLGYFIPGAAFPAPRDGAWLVGAEVQFRF